MIEVLFERLREMEASKRFNGSSYPSELVPFPRRLVGQGFFPGGNGLWRSDEPAKMRAPSTCQFPENGIMFLGNDFGSVFGFSRLKLHENPPTWRHLRVRLRHANIDGEIGFYTNAFLGLRNDRNALAHPINDKQYDQFCGEFLEFQILTQRPKLIVILGERPNTLFRQVVSCNFASVGTVAKASLGSLLTNVITVSHPYSDLNKSDNEKLSEGLILSRAWQSA